MRRSRRPRPSEKTQLVLNTLTQEILAGQYSATGLFPTQSQLIERFGISSAIISEVVIGLKRLGLIEVKSTKNTSIEGRKRYFLKAPENPQGGSAERR